MKLDNLLIELLVEELPPKALKKIEKIEDSADTIKNIISNFREIPV